MTPNFGIDLSSDYTIKGAVEWAIDNDVNYVDVRLTERIDPAEYDETEFDRIRQLCNKNDISLGLHTLSAVNTAAFTPYVAEAVEKYLFAFVDIAANVDADRTIVHAGYHFTTDEERRRDASLQRLERLIDRAESKDVTLLLENMNPEPANAEVQYLCSELEDVERYFDRLASPNLRWAFNPPHAHLHESGISGFIGALDLDICREVRLNDNRGIREEHLMPGEGTIDFENLFDHLEQVGYEGPHTVAVGTPEDAKRAIEYLDGLR